MEFPPDFVYERWPIVERLAQTILASKLQNKDLNDHDVYLAIEGLAETYRTLSTGIYYERPPDWPTARALYGNLAEAVQNARNKEPQRIGLSSVLLKSPIFSGCSYF